jgi:hypothetical protein
MKQRKCILCHSVLSGKKSNEHIFPQWVLEYFNIRKEKISPSHWSIKNNKFVSSREHNLDNFLAGSVCGDCNNKWMSDLENSAKENIIQLSEDRKGVIDLDEQERFILARWSFKTALMLNWGSNYFKNIPQDHYSYLYNNNNSLPERVAVVAQQHHYNRPFYWLQSSTWELLGNSFNDVRLEELENRSYKIGIQLKHLLLLVAYNPSPNYVFVYWKGIHVPLYPMRGPVVWEVKNDSFEWNDSINALFQFHFSLGLAEKQV